MPFAFDKLLNRFNHYPAASTYVVALSGGMDSCVLLKLACEISSYTDVPVRALHVNHGLQSEAKQWEVHCQAVCDRLHIPLEIIQLNLAPKPGDSIEAIAREGRYGAFECELKQNELLLLAHHQDDQAETLLLQMLRGAGPEGLAAMPETREFVGAVLCRPLLDFTRDDLALYAKEHDLKWIEDPSNADTRYDRNYLRQHVMPLLKQRWPAASKTLSRSARLCATSSEVVREHGEKLLTQVSVKDSKHLSVEKLQSLSSSEQAIVLREWFKWLSLASPSEAHLVQVLRQMLESEIDATPYVNWENVEVRRHRGKLYAFTTRVEFDSDRTYSWDGKSDLVLGDQQYVLRAISVAGRGIKQSSFERGGFAVSFRNETEKQICSKSARKIMQQKGVLPWERERVPLVSRDGILISIAGYWIAPQFRASKDEAGVELVWIKIDG